MAKKRSKKKPRRQPAMKITDGRRQHILALAEALAAIAPSTARGNAFCVQHVAVKKGLKSCWKHLSNKRKSIAHLLEHTIRKYPRKPKALVLAITKGGVVWMARKGERVTPEHLEAVAAPMHALGFNIRKDLRKIAIPEPSKVRDPASDKVGLLRNLQLHPCLTDDCFEMFKDGHFNESVRKALERFEKRVQDLIGDSKTIGKQLMGKAFGGATPPIAINALTSGTDISEQEGFAHLTMGAMASLRNLYSHSDADQMNATDAIERLAFVSMLFRRVDTAIVSTTP